MQGNSQLNSLPYLRDFKAEQEKIGLTILNVSDTEISLERAKEIEATLQKNTDLTCLYLGGCKITDEGAKLIAAVLEGNKILESFELQGCEITDECLKEIKAALIRREVPISRGFIDNQIENLNYNKIERAGIEELSEITKEGRTVSLDEQQIEKAPEENATSTTIASNNVPILTGQAGTEVIEEQNQQIQQQNIIPQNSTSNNFQILPEQEEEIRQQDTVPVNYASNNPQVLNPDIDTETDRMLGFENTMSKKKCFGIIGCWTTSGILTGAATGALMGWKAASSISPFLAITGFIPVIGPIIASGGIIAMTAGIILGAIIGAITGGVIAGYKYQNSKKVDGVHNTAQPIKDTMQGSSAHLQNVNVKAFSF